jgi:hypothetical protein
MNLDGREGEEEPRGVEKAVTTIRIYCMRNKSTSNKVQKENKEKRKSRQGRKERRKEGEGKGRGEERRGEERRGDTGLPATVLCILILFWKEMFHISFIF